MSGFIKRTNKISNHINDINTEIRGTYYEGCGCHNVTFIFLALGKLLNETEAWIDESEKKMSEEPLHQMPTVTASKIAEKGITLDREVKFLVNKARIAKRKADDEAAAKAAKDKADAAAKKKKKAEKAANDTEEADGKHRIDICIVLLL